MSFGIKGWKMVTPVGAPDSLAGTALHFFSYVTNDLLSAVAASDYFLTRYKEPKVGDVIMAVVDVDGTPDFVFLQVTAASSSTVTTQSKVSAVVGDQTGLADLTENSGAVGGTSDGDLPALTGSPAGTDAAIITALIASVRELTVRSNAHNAALLASGLQAAP